jgi:hypothetical protein
MSQCLVLKLKEISLAPRECTRESQRDGDVGVRRSLTHSLTHLFISDTRTDAGDTQAG